METIMYTLIAILILLLVIINEQRKIIKKQQKKLLYNQQLMQYHKKRDEIISHYLAEYIFDNISYNEVLKKLEQELALVSDDDVVGWKEAYHDTKNTITLIEIQKKASK